MFQTDTDAIGAESSAQSGRFEQERRGCFESGGLRQRSRQNRLADSVHARFAPVSLAQSGRAAAIQRVSTFAGYDPSAGSRGIHSISLQIFAGLEGSF